MTKTATKKTKAPAVKKKTAKKKAEARTGEIRISVNYSFEADANNERTAESICNSLSTISISNMKQKEVTSSIGKLIEKLL